MTHVLVYCHAGFVNSVSLTLCPWIHSFKRAFKRAFFFLVRVGGSLWSLLSKERRCHPMSRAAGLAAGRLPPPRRYSSRSGWLFLVPAPCGGLESRPPSPWARGEAPSPQPAVGFPGCFCCFPFRMQRLSAAPRAGCRFTTLAVEDLQV